MEGKERKRKKEVRKNKGEGRKKDGKENEQNDLGEGELEE